MLLDAWKAGADAAEIHRRSFAGEFDPGTPLDLRLPAEADDAKAGQLVWLPRRRESAAALVHVLAHRAQIAAGEDREAGERGLGRLVVSALTACSTPSTPSW